jgi:hypothetical protein
MWGMVAGVAMLALAFAWMSALPAFVRNVRPSALGWSIRLAANVRPAISLLSLGWVDLGFGLVAVSIVQGGQGVLGTTPMNDHTFLKTLLITLCEGILVSTTMFLLALVIWPGRSYWQRRSERNRVAITGVGTNSERDGAV